MLIIGIGGACGEAIPATGGATELPFQYPGVPAGVAATAGITADRFGGGGGPPLAAEGTTGGGGTMGDMRANDVGGNASVGGGGTPLEVVTATCWSSRPIGGGGCRRVGGGCCMRAATVEGGWEWPLVTMAPLVVVGVALLLSAHSFISWWLIRGSALFTSTFLFCRVT